MLISLPPFAESKKKVPSPSFFECSNCGRGYALKRGKQLTFRWLHPVTLALYDIISDVTPVERAESIAQKLAA
jgi:hypothetical protein